MRSFAKTLGLITFSISMTFSVIVDASSIKLRFSHNLSEDTPKGQMATHFQALIKQRLGDDKVLVEVYPNSSLYDDFQIVDKILDNSVEIAAPSISKLMEIAPRLKLFDLPFLFVSPEAADNFLKGEYGERLLRLVQRNGLLGLGFLNNGLKQLSTNFPAKLPQDLRSLTFRIKDSDVLQTQFEQLNAYVIRKPIADISKLLDSGEIDGQENTWSNFYAKKFYKYQKNIIESNHGYLGYMLITNPSFWNELPSDIRTVLEQSLSDAIEYGNLIAAKRDISDKKKVINGGFTLVQTLSNEERKLWVDTLRPVWKKYEDLIGSDLINAAASSR